MTKRFLMLLVAGFATASYAQDHQGPVEVFIKEKLIESIKPQPFLGNYGATIQLGVDNLSLFEIKSDRTTAGFHPNEPDVSTSISYLVKLGWGSEVVNAYLTCENSLVYTSTVEIAEYDSLKDENSVRKIKCNGKLIRTGSHSADCVFVGKVRKLDIGSHKDDCMGSALPVQD